MRTRIQWAVLGAAVCWSWWLSSAVTVAQEKDEQTLKQDLEGLIETWREIEKAVKTEQPPALLYKDMSTTSSVIRDLFSNDVSRVVIDDKKAGRTSLRR